MRLGIFSAFIAASLATPLTSRQVRITGKSDSWEPDVVAKVACDTTSDKIIGFYVGPQLETVVNDACAAMFPPCAYSDRVAPDTFCIQSIDWKLGGPKTSIQAANVETKQGVKISGWNVKFAVTPAVQPAGSAGVFWTIQDCYGYFAVLLEKWEPEGCHRAEGFGTGGLRVGGESSLNGSIFRISIVPAV
ncbi:hypothetical protein IQ07DRAFT_591327 [Pyrenochaeta sp. DS3sAY3a]|nr:hypothetical protein IQ07DRAFT_591327 [Pyrenochaeta sp. DS3sAY3a]